MSTFIRKNETTPRTSSRMAKTATDSGRRRARRTIHMRGGFRPDVARARTYRHVPHARARMAVAIAVSAPCGGRHEPVLRRLSYVGNAIERGHAARHERHAHAVERIARGEPRAERTVRRRHGREWSV